MLEPVVRFEDTHLVVVAKPAGFLSQGEHRGDPNVVDWLRARLGRDYVGLVHRLDRNTSGLMVVAKRTKAASRLTAALQGGDVFRSYLAWVHGTIEGPRRWTHRLLKDEAANRVAVVAPQHPRGKDATLTITPLGRGRWHEMPLTLCELVLETGRSHQIRVQAAHEGHALLGDLKYGGRRDGFPRPALHSHRLHFPHPMSGARIEVIEEIPADLVLPGTPQ